MPRFPVVPFSLASFFLFQASAFAQNPPQPTAELASSLTFETESAGALAGWSGGPPDTLQLDHEIVHSGKSAGRIERGPLSKKKVSVFTHEFSLEVTGKKLELRGWLRTKDVSEFSGLWMQLMGAEEPLGFENMEKRAPAGTTEWTHYSIELPLDPRGRFLSFGVGQVGTGITWADDLELLVDGKPIWEAPKPPPPTPTVLETDTEFASGSNIAVLDLSSDEIRRFATLGRVWGFLKYHHPAVTGGKYQWDFELFRIMPAILNATTDQEAEHALVAWIDRLGPVGPVGEAKPSAEKIALSPDLRWFATVGLELRARLEMIRAARPQLPEQFYFKQVPYVSNPDFGHELGYPKIKSTDAGYQLLALFRYWNIIRYWYPYRDLIEGDWDRTLDEFVPRFAVARHAQDYHLELLALIARVNDTHSNLWSDLAVRPPAGAGQLPVRIRFIEGQPLITAMLATDGPSPLQAGDVIVSLDGRPIGELIKEWAPYYAASNEPTRLRDIASSLGGGAIGPVQVEIDRGGTRQVVTAQRVGRSQLPRETYQNDRAGPAFQKIGDDVAYLKLSAVKEDAAGAYVQQTMGTKGLIIDARNYPSASLIFALGGHLVDKPTEFAAFTKARAENPGEFHFAPGNLIAPLAPHYPGRIVVLVNELTQSFSEYHAMAFRAVPGALVIGSTTAGADGNVSFIPLPGGQRGAISGIGVFYPDHRPTQRIGIVPDIVRTPTIAGMRAGRDEVLEEALRQILGPGTPEETIRALATPPAGDPPKSPAGSAK